ncbi:MAG: hypothetical protein ACTH5W_01410 [Providencia sp.]|uniref:hypothetical protein n=1 Tax=Providencia sp. TaxID=589 RepID=UPI003F97280C
MLNLLIKKNEFISYIVFFGIILLVPSVLYGNNFKDKLYGNNLEMLLSINQYMNFESLISMTNELDKNIKLKNNSIEKIFYGYGMLFISDIYVKNNKPANAAESVKKAFYSIDEAVESNNNQWQLKYLRLRMDAFVPQALGRCVVAIADSRTLMRNTNVVQEFLPMLEYMQARALMSCNRKDESKILMRKLFLQNDTGKILSQYGYTGVPPWSVSEIESIFPPLL